MARNTKSVGKKKVAKKRAQTVNPKTGLYVKRVAATKFILVEEEDVPYGVTKEEITKMSPVLKKLAEYDKNGKQSAG